MLQAITRLAIAAPRRIIAITVLVLLAAAIFGIPVINSLSGGGFQDPTSESARATDVLRDKLGQTDQKMLVVETAPAGALSDRARGVGTDIVDHLRRSPWVLDVSSPWTSPPQAAAQLVSKDNNSGMIVADLKGGENKAQDTTAALVMSISFAAMIPAHVSFMRMLGVGLTLAVLADATLVRMVLVPAFIHLLGRWTWWAPKPLAWLRDRAVTGEAAAARVGRRRWAADAPKPPRPSIRRWPTRAVADRG